MNKIQRRNRMKLVEAGLSGKYKQTIGRYKEFSSGVPMYCWVGLAAELANTTGGDLAWGHVYDGTVTSSTWVSLNDRGPRPEPSDLSYDDDARRELGSMTFEELAMVLHLETLMIDDGAL